MKKRWNLDKLYTSFDSPALLADVSEVDKLIQKTLEFTSKEFKTNENVAGKLLAYLKLSEELNTKASLIGTFSSITYAVDTENMIAMKCLEKIEAYSAKFTEISVVFRKWLASIDHLEEIIVQNEELKPFTFAILSEKKEAKYLLSDAEEILLAEMKNTGSESWSKLQDSTLSSLMVDYEGEQVPFSVIRNNADSPNAEVRRKSYEAELKSYEKIEKVSAFCINAIKGEVITVAKKRGYTSPLEMTLVSSRMDKETLDAMLLAITEYLPKFREYLKKKAKMLGHSDALPFYDLFAPMGAVDMQFTPAQAKAFIIEKFSSFSENLGNYGKKAFEQEWIDSEPRKGKVGGAFCANVHPIGESRIMLNFTGSFSDVSTLAHELGHGYHGECLKNESFVNSDYPMPLAETASIFCETIINQATLKNASKEEAIMILESGIMGATQVVVDIYSRYLFETALFEKRVDSSLSVEELKEEMLKAQKTAYGDGLDHKYLHPNMWTCKPHYYYSEYNFYNFPYAFGLLFAKGLYAKYLELGEAFIPKYDELLRATGCNDIHAVLATMGIDSHSPDFFRGSLSIIAQDIDAFLAL